MKIETMRLKVILPFQIFLDKKNICRVVAETHAGSYGFLPRRLDCVTAIAPGLLAYTDEKEEEHFLAVDEGILIKTADDIVISARNAVSGENLSQLREAVQINFIERDEKERDLRSVLLKMESNLMVSLSEYSE